MADIRSLAAVDLHLMEAVLQATPYPHLVLQACEGDFRIVEANQAAATAMREQREKLLGMRLFERYFPGDTWAETGQHLRESLERVIATGLPDRLGTQRYDLPTADGHEEHYWRSVNVPVCDRQGTVVYVLHCVEDVTEVTRHALNAETWSRAEAELRRVYEQAPVPMAVTRGPEHRYAFANARYFELSGRRTVVGKTVQEAFPELAGQGIYELLDEVYATGVPYHAQERPLQISSDGVLREVCYDFSYQPLVDERGRVEGITVVATDVTDRVRARAEADQAILERERLAALQVEARQRIEAAEARLRRVFEEAPVAIAVLRGPDHVFEVANPGYLGLVHKPREALIGRPLREVMPELVGQGIFELLEGVYTTGLPFAAPALPVSLLLPSGELVERVFNFVYQPLQVPPDGVDSIVVVAIDVTDVARARETAERLAEERDGERRQLESVLAQSPVGIAIAEAPSGRVRFTNARYGEILGKNPDLESIDQYGSHFRCFTPDGRLVDAREWPLSRAVLRGEVVEGEVLLVEQPGGHKREVTWNAAPVRDPQGVIRAGVVVFRDITDERRTEQRLRDAQRLQSVGTLAGGVAHEVNNALQGVLGFGEFVLRALGPDHPQAADIRVVLQSGERAARVSQQLLAFTRQQTTQPRALDLHALVADLRPVLQQLLGSDKPLVIRPAAPMSKIYADPAQVQQVLINLVANARDATETGSAVTVTVDEADVAPDTVSPSGVAVAPGRYGRLTVTDHGHGMDEATLAHIFEPFFTTKPVGAGTGLGMSMVYGIVKQQGGYVWVRSAPGRGTTVETCWPVPAGAESPGPTAKAATGELTQPRALTILVADDEPLLRTFAARSLQAERFGVVTAEDGVAALAILERARVDLVVTDVIMPRMNGRQLYDAVAERWPDLPVLFISGHAGGDAVLERLVPSGAPFLQKPFTPKALRSAVAALLDPIRSRS